MKTDELLAHLDMHGIICFKDLCEKVNSFTVEDGISNPIKFIDCLAKPKLLFKVKTNMQFEGFHFETRCFTNPAIITKN